MTEQYMDFKELHEKLKAAFAAVKKDIDGLTSRQMLLRDKMNKDMKEISQKVERNLQSHDERRQEYEQSLYENYTKATDTVSSFQGDLDSIRKKSEQFDDALEHITIKINELVATLNQRPKNTALKQIDRRLSEIEKCMANLRIDLSDESYYEQLSV